MIFYLFVEHPGLFPAGFRCAQNNQYFRETVCVQSAVLGMKSSPIVEDDSRAQRFPGNAIPFEMILFCIAANLLKAVLQIGVIFTAECIVVSISAKAIILPLAKAPFVFGSGTGMRGRTIGLLALLLLLLATVTGSLWVLLLSRMWWSTGAVADVTESLWVLSLPRR